MSDETKKSPGEQEKSGFDRRKALKVMGAAAAIQAVPKSWKRPFVSAGSAPAFAQATGLGTGDLQVTLTWDQANDCDIYLREPDGTWVYYGNPSGTNATLDFDDTDGFGPENIFIPPGGAENDTYFCAVDLYSNGSVSGDTTCAIRITTFDGTPSEQQQTINRVLTPADESFGTLGFNVADIDFPSGNITESIGTVSLPRGARKAG